MQPSSIRRSGRRDDLGYHRPPAGAAGWLATDAHPGRSSAPLILALAAAAMGVQSVATISSGARVAPSWALALPAVLVAAVVMVTAVLARHGMEGS
jgi:hypothetical protein